MEFFINRWKNAHVLFSYREGCNYNNVNNIFKCVGGTILVVLLWGTVITNTLK